MLRIVGIGVGLLLVVIAGAAGFGYYQAEQNLGLSESPRVGFEEVLDPSVRLAVVLQPEKGLEYVKGLLPERISQMPSWLPWNLHELLDRGMVREAALLVAPDDATDRLNATLFVNEKRGGPAIVAQGSTQPFFTQSAPIVWNTPALELPSRGLLRGGAHVPMADTVTEAVRAYWQAATNPVAIEITRNHLAEAYLDNSDGALLSIAGAMAEAYGGKVDSIMADQNARDIITTIGALRVAADITGPDTITIQLAVTPAVNSTEENQKKIPFVVNFLAFPFLSNEAKKRGLTLEWSENKKTALVDGLITAEMKLSGFREQLQNQINVALGSN